MKNRTVPKFAILLAAYNGVNWIEEQIESILNQENVYIEIFISIDISSDGTRAFLENLYKNNTRIHILDDVERFGGAAKNFYRLIKDVDFSDFDYVSLSDQDDIWNSDKLFNAFKVLAKNNCDGYSSNVLAVWYDGKSIVIDKAQEQTYCDYLFEAAGPGCTYVLSIKLALNIKSFIISEWLNVNKVELHDWLIYAFSRENGYKWYIDKNTSMQYRQHASNQVGASSGIDAKYKRLKMVMSSWYRNETIKIINLLRIENKYPFSSLILNKSYINNILLLKYIYKFRRKSKEKVLLFIIVLIGIY